MLYRILLPYSIFNYSAGFFKLDFSRFIFINIVGLIPRTLMISSLGSGLNQVFFINEHFFLSFINNAYTKLFLLMFITLHLLKRLNKD